MSSIENRYGNDLDLDEVIELYHASTLGQRRPVGNRATMARMLEHGTSWSRPGTARRWWAFLAR